MILPKVSVIIPTKNRIHTVINAINTVGNQDYKGFIEVLVVSDDEPEKRSLLVQRIEQLALPKNIKVGVIPGEHKGPTGARNLGIRMAVGKYLAFLDDDDTWMQSKIREQVTLLDHKNFSYIPLCVCFIDDRRFGTHRINETPDVVTYDYALKTLNLQSTSAYMVRSSMVEEFDETLPSAQEYDLALRLLKKGNAITIPKILVIQNETQGQISEDWSKKIHGILAIRKKYIDSYNTFLSIKVYLLALTYAMGFLVGNNIYGLLTFIRKRVQ